MNILITTSSFGLEDKGVFEPLINAGLSYKLNPYGRTLTEEEAVKLYAKYMPAGVIAGTEPITARVIEANQKLRVISRAGVDLGNVDGNAARQRGILVFNTPEAPAVAVAELTVGLILSVLRHIVRSDRSIRSGEWNKYMGNLLGKRVVGLIGCGSIGKATAKLLRAFGCKVLGYDPYVNETKGIELVSSKEELLSRSDIVSLHVPLTGETKHFIDAGALQTMKPGSIFINASRGGVVDDTALLAWLESGHIAGAALDTFEREPYHGPLAEREDVVLTPHIGSYARECRVRMEREASENVVRGLSKLEILK